MDVATIVINISFPIVIVIGFFIFYGKSNGWFKKGGLVYEWWKNKRKEMKKKKK